MKTTFQIIAALLLVLTVNAQVSVTSIVGVGKIGSGRYGSQYMPPQTFSPAFVSYSTNSFNGTDTILPVPTGITANGVLIAMITTDTAANIETSIPAGWVLVTSNANVGIGFNLAVKTTDGTESGSIVFPFVDTEEGSSVVAFYAHCTTNFVDAPATGSAGFGSGGVTVNSQTHTFTSTNSMAIAVFYNQLGNNTFTQLSDPIRGESIRNGVTTLLWSDELQAGSGTVSLAVQFNQSTTVGTTTFTLRPVP